MKRLLILFFCFFITTFSLIVHAIVPENTSDSEDERISHNAGITIKKVDSVTLEALENAEFELSKNSQFKGANHFIIKTNQDGIAMKEHLSPGKWYLREKTAPTGYIRYTETTEIFIENDEMKTICLKNTPYGKINILKKDSLGTPVSGATFTIYSGETVDSEKIFKDDLISNENGEIFVDDVIPGMYTITEKKAAEGYHLNNSPLTKEVLAGNVTDFEIENDKIQKCCLKLFKKDVETKEQLEGATFGVYSDAEFTNLIATSSSFKEQVTLIENLDPGTYYIKEIEAPEGYLLDAPAQNITLEEGQSAEVVFENSKNIPTAGNFGMKIVVGSALLILSSTMTIVMRFYLRKKYNVT